MNKNEALELSEIIKKDFHFNYVNGNQVTHHIFYPKSQPVGSWLKQNLPRQITDQSALIGELSDEADLSLYLVSVLKSSGIVLYKDFEEHLSQTGLKTKFVKYLGNRPNCNN